VPVPSPHSIPSRAGTGAGALLLLPLLLLPTPLLAQKKGAPAPAAEPAVGAVRELAYYVPYEELEQVFESAGRGIFLPYDEFLRLWRKAEGTPPDERPRPPTPTVVRGGSYTGVVGERSARLSASYVVESLEEGWTETRLPLDGVAIETVELSDLEALFVAREGSYSLLIPRPGPVEVRLAFSVPVIEEPGKRSIRFRVPPLAASRLELEIPEPELRVDVEPLLAATSTSAADGRTRLLAFLGDSDAVTVAWMPPLGRAGDDGALVHGTQRAHAALDERVLRLSTDIVIAVLRGEVDTFRIALPEGMQLIAVEGENLKEWRPVAGTLTVALHAAVKDSYRLQLRFERILEAVPPTLDVRLPRIEDLFKESGYLTFEHDPGLRARVTATEGLSQLDPEEVPEELRAPGRIGWRYLAPPVSLSLEVEKIAPRVRTEVVSVVSLGRTEDHWIGWVDGEIARAGVFRLSLAFPLGWEVESIGDPATVEEFQVEDEAARRIVRVNLRSKALGAFRLPFRLVREGTARAGEVSVSPPVVLESEQDRGILGVAAPRSFEVVTAERSELVDADVDELFRTGILGQLPAEAAIPRAMRYRKHPASARLVLTERRTEIDLLAQHLVEVADGEIRVTHLLDHEILFAAVDAVRFRAPSVLDDSLTVEAKQKTQVRKVSSEGGLTLWEVGLQPPALGSLTLSIHHTIPLAALEAGVPRDVAIPLVRGVGARGVQGFIAIRKEGTLEVRPEATGMEAIDAGDLPDKLRRGRVYGGFRYFVAEPALSLSLTRYDHETLADAVVSRMRLRSVMSEERQLKTEAVLWMQNSGRPFLELALPADARILSLSVDGRSQSPRRRKEGSGTLVEIPRSAGPAGTFTVILVYEESLPGGAMGRTGTARISAPEVLAGIPVGGIDLDLYLPRGYEYLAHAGNLHRRAEDRPGTWERFQRLLGIANERAMAVPEGGGGSLPATPAVVIELPTEGMELHRFETLAPTGTLSFRYIGSGLHGFLSFALLAAAALATALALRRVRAKALLAAALLFVALSGSWFTRGATAELAGSLLFGIVAGCALHGGRGALAGIRSWRANRRAHRLALAPDPFIEEAGGGAKGGGPPAAGGGTPPGTGG